MPIAVDPNSGSTVFLSGDGSWQPAQTAVNPQTKEVQAFDGQSWVPVPAKSKGFLGYVDDAVRSIASGVTFGYADEIAARGNAMLGNGDYESNLSQEQARDKAIPGAIKYPGEIAGAVGSALAAAPITGAIGAASGLSRLPGLVRAGLGGAAGGAAFGSGDAEPGQRLAGAAQGAAIGSVVGPAAYGVVKGAGALANEVRGAFSPQQNVTRDLSRALQRDNMTPDQLLQGANELNAVRPGVATIADAGGENVKGLLERVAQTPGAGRTIVNPALTQRQQEQLGRLSGDLRELTGTTQTAFKATEETMAKRAADAAPLYKTAIEQDGDKAIWSPVLEQLSSAPSVRGAMQRAVRTWRDNAVADGYGAMNPGAMVGRGDQLSFPGGSVPVFPNLQFWDYTKRSLDRQIDVAIRNGDNSTVRTLTKLVTPLREELDRAVPSYAAARNAWGGPSQYMKAIEEGRNIFDTKISAEQLSAALPHMAESDREGFMVGAVTAAIKKMRDDPAKMPDLTKYLRSPEVRDKIAAMMPTEEARAAWKQRLNFEVSSSELTGRTLGNSATARRLAERQDSENIVGDLVMDAFSGHPPVSLLKNALFAVPKRLRDTLRSRSDEILARVLTQPGGVNGPQFRQAIEDVGKVGQRAQPSPAAAINATNATVQAR